VVSIFYTFLRAEDSVGSPKREREIPLRVSYNSSTTLSHHHPIESSRTYFITDRKQLSSTASSFLPPLHNPPHFPANKVQTLPKVPLAGDHSPHQPPSGLQTSHQPCYLGKSPPAYHLPLIISQIIHQM